MPNIYSELKKDLGKLERNETQMSDEQRVKYKKGLDNLRLKIRKQAVDIMLEFLLGDIKAMPEEIKECTTPIMQILDEKASDKLLHGALDTLFKEYSIDDCIETLYPLRDRIMYEGYAPYWLKYCRIFSPEEIYQENGGNITGWNDLIQMGWWVTGQNGDGVWKKPGKMIMKDALPPTAELIQKEYKEVKERYA